MLPLPLAGNSTIAHCSRRDEVPVPPLLPALVALWSAAIATMCCCDDALGLPWYRSTCSCVEPNSWGARNLGARNRDAAVAASSFIVTHIVVATAQFLIVRAATKRRYRRCCPLLWRCGLLRSRRCAVVTMRSVFPGTAALVRAWNLQLSNLRRTRLPCSSPQRLARRGAHASPFSNPTTGCRVR